MSELDEIRARVAAATTGPWERDSMDSGHSRYAMDHYVTTPDTGDTICDMVGLSRSRNERWAMDDGQADAEFIAHAREDIPRLLAALDAIQEFAVIAETLCDLNSTPRRLASVPVVQIRNAIEAALKRDGG